MTAPRKTLRTAQDLAEAGLVPEAQVAELERVAARYAVAVTPALAGLIESDAPGDPMARQFLPDPRELDKTPGESADPIGDGAHSAVPGIVHRYPDRVLLKIVGVCAVYCRFCFRREAVGPEAGHSLSVAELEQALDYIRCRPSIWEVIVTGGDPLVLSPRRVGEVSAALGSIPHVAVVRWHTRLPIAAPERITGALAAALRIAGKAVYVALHANHPDELTPAACTAVARLVDAGLPMVSQTVLLTGVNDDAETLERLMRTLAANRIKPYYLHHCDRAPGTAHFQTSIERGRELVRSLRGRLSGLAQPTYVLDIPGGHGKVPVAPCYLHGGPGASKGGAYVVEDYNGHQHVYEDLR